MPQLLISRIPLSQANLQVYLLIMQEISIGWVKESAAEFRVPLPRLVPRLLPPAGLTGGTSAPHPGCLLQPFPAALPARACGVSPALLRETGFGQREREFTAPGVSLGTSMGSISL